MFRKVLLVEDDSITRGSMSHHLRNEGYEVTEARDGDQAAKLIGTDNFDLMITDFLVPHVDGLKLISRIQSRSPHTRIILMSGYVSTDTGSLLLQDNETGNFLKKPIQLESLSATVKALLPH